MMPLFEADFTGWMTITLCSFVQNYKCEISGEECDQVEAIWRDSLVWYQQRWKTGNQHFTRNWQVMRKLLKSGENDVNDFG
jgi:hypothetical protein